MPYEKDSSSVDDYQLQLSYVESIISENPDSLVILGGDFNVDLSRNWSNTKLLVDYCEQSNLYPVDKHELSTVEYTYHFNMNYFSSIDHFIFV